MVPIISIFLFFFPAASKTAPSTTRPVISLPRSGSRATPVLARGDSDLGDRNRRGSHEFSATHPPQSFHPREVDRTVGGGCMRSCHPQSFHGFVSDHSFQVTIFPEEVWDGDPPIVCEHESRRFVTFTGPRVRTSALVRVAWLSVFV